MKMISKFQIKHLTNPSQEKMYNEKYCLITSFVISEICNKLEADFSHTTQIWRPMVILRVMIHHGKCNYYF